MTDQPNAQHQDVLRTEIRRFLAEHWAGDPSDDDDQRRFWAAALAAGFVGRSVPVEYGGRGEPFDPVAEWTILDEFLDAGAPPLPLQSTGVVHALLKHGTAPQRDAYIRATLEGRLRWCQGFSEPDAGSDLANLRSRADLDGDAWILNGQKIWTSSAIEADMMFGLFRTERDVPGGRGISYLLVPMDLPGITVRPIRQMTGPDEFNEVFFDDVRCPTANLVGERGGGWSVVRSALSYERIGFGNPRQLRRGVDSLVAMARRFGVDGTRPIDDTRIRFELARINELVAVQECAFVRMLVAISSEQEDDVASELVMVKQYEAIVGERSVVLAAELLGHRVLLSPPDSEARQTVNSFTDENWAAKHLGRIGKSISGGTSNIQRNIIAEQILGLPRDQRPS